MLRIAKAFTLVGACFACGLLGGSALARAAQDANPYAGLDTLARALTAVEQHYVEPIPTLDLLHSAVRGMVSDLDPHSVYLAPDEYQRLQERTEGHFFGVGVEIVQEDDGIRVSRVVPRAPAALAGVRAGDRLLRVDGQAVQDIDTAGALLSGARGTPVVLGVQRDQQPLDITVVRDQVLDIAVDGALFSPGVAYIRIEHFRRRVSEEVRRLMTDLAEQGGRPLEAIVLDLREDPGGLLDEAVAVVDLFTSEGTIVETRGRDGQLLETHAATASEHDSDARLVVLVDAGSASASEIVAGALQDMGRATLVGTRSYGKGSVQEIYEFEDGSALKLTVARYYLPSGRTVPDREGLQPDLRVSREIDDGTRDLRAQIGALEIPEATRSALLEQLTALPLRELPPPDIDRSGTPTERLSRDPQLEAAWRRATR